MGQAYALLRVCLGTFLLLLVAAMPARAANRALLIGVSCVDFSFLAQPALKGASLRLLTRDVLPESGPVPK